jgi:hypothetical protein
VRHREQSGIPGALALITLIVFAWPPFQTRAQEPAGKDKQGTRDVLAEALYRGDGEAVSEGTDSLAVGPLQVTGYRLEEMKLPQPAEINLRGEKQRVQSVLRLVVFTSGGDIPAGQYRIWVNDDPVGDAVYGPSEFRTLIFDRSVLENGASISVTRNGDEGSRSTVPARLQLPKGFHPAQAARRESLGSVHLSRVAAAPSIGYRPGIEVEIVSEVPFPTLDSSPVLQIGGKEITSCGHPPSGESYILRCLLPEEEFDQIKDGETIKVRFSGNPYPWGKFGRLDKGKLKHSPQQ